MDRRGIWSHPHEDDPHVWAEFEVADGSLDIEVTALNGIGPFRRRQFPDMPEQSHAAAHVMMKSHIRKRKLQLSKKYPTDLHLLTLSHEGDLLFLAHTETEAYGARGFYANLAWYEPSTGEWTRLVFVPGDEEGQELPRDKDGNYIPGTYPPLPQPVQAPIV